MKKEVILPILLFILLALPFASASILDWLGLTGEVTEAGTTTSAITEQIKCIFTDSSEMQKCYTDDGKFSCSGIGSCIADVSGTQGEQLRWKSTCGGEVLTVIDGNNDEMAFKCPAVIATPTSVCGNSACESGETCSSCSSDCGTCLKSQVKCTFLNSNSEQKCYASNGLFSCSGVGSCTTAIEEASGKQIEWKSTCGGYFYTYVKADGSTEEIIFNCPTLVTISGGGTSTTTQTATSEEVKEQIKCLFYESNSYQKCYASDGMFGCSGVGSCVADVIGEKGKQLTWKSSCGGYAYTAIDGNNDYAEFKCAQAATATPVSAESIKEQVKCLFINSNKEQECYSSEGFKCSGTGSCVADISSDKLYGKQLMWKSTCGGDAYTIADGNNEYAEFKCGETPTPQPVTQVNIVKKASIYAFIQDRCSYCEKMKDFMAALRQKYTAVEANYLTVIPSPEQAYNLVVATYLKKGIPAIFLNNKVWNGFNDDIAKEIEAEVNLCIEKGCSSNPNPPIPDEIKMYISSTSTSTSAAALPKIAIIQAPVQEGNAKEQIRCIFKSSDVLLNPHTARPEKCMTDDGAFGCIWDGNVEVGENGKRKAYCVAAVDGAAGKKLIWKSSCGGYAYNVIDGNNEDVEFSCIPAINVTAEQIGGKGFAYAYWQCYDGKEYKSSATNCKTSEVWQQEAKNSCRNNCKIEEMAHPHKKCPLGLSKDAPVGKAVVKEKEYSFELISVLNDTTIILKIINPDGAAIQQKFVFEERKNAFDVLAVTVGSSYPGRVDIVVEGGEDIDCMKCGINSFAVSNDCYLESGKEGVIFTPIEEKEAKIGEALVCGDACPIPEKALICKDSCPFNNKCYPFGYRKADRFCSDNNAFIPQLKSQESCENSFECKSNVCIAGKCISENLIQKVLNWFNKLFIFSGEETKEESIDCGASSECMENAFKVCKPAKISSQSGPISEIAIVGLEKEKCVMKWTAGTESMTCKFEDYISGLKDRGAGSLEQYCKGDLVKKLATASKIQSLSAEEVIHKEVEIPAETEFLDATSACEKIRNPAFKYECTAMLKKDASDCELISEQVTRPSCYADVALAAKDSAICKKIEDLGHRGACEALVERDKDKCSKWIYADYCYRDVAALIGDPSICDYIKYEGGKKECKAVILRDVSLCENTDSEDCYQKLALLTGDESVCAELSKVKIDGSRPIAIANLDEEVTKCIKMAKKEITGCLFKSGSGTDCDLIPAFAKNPSLCENLKSDYEGFADRDLCYFYAAMSTADLLPPQLIVL